MPEPMHSSMPVHVSTTIDACVRACAWSSFGLASQQTLMCACLHWGAHLCGHLRAERRLYAEPAGNTLARSLNGHIRTRTHPYFGKIVERAQMHAYTPPCLDFREERRGLAHGPRVTHIRLLASDWFRSRAIAPLSMRLQSPERPGMPMGLSFSSRGHQ